MRAFFRVELRCKDAALFTEFFFIGIPPTGDLSDFFLQGHAIQQIIQSGFDWQRRVFVGGGILARDAGGCRKADQLKRIVFRINKHRVGHFFQPALFDQRYGLNAGLSPAIPHVLGIPIGVDVGNGADHVAILFDVIEELDKPFVPNRFRFFEIEKVAARCCFRHEYRLADFPCECQGRQCVLVSAPPGVANPIVIIGARIVFFKLSRFHAARGCENRGIVCQSSGPQGVHNPPESFFEILGVVIVPATIEFVPDANEKGVIGMISNELHKLIYQVIKGSIGYFVFAVSLHGNRDVHDTGIENRRVEVSLLMHGA